MKLLLRAAALDPVAVALFLARRTARHLKRRVTRTEAVGPFPLFAECDPTERSIVHRSADEIDNAWLSAFERRRLRQLTALDEPIATATAVQPSDAPAHFGMDREEA
jgi:hypothetical protein